MRIALINHTFQQERYIKRWKMLAEDHKDLDVTLLAPTIWVEGARSTLTYGKEIERVGKIYDEDNFHIRTFNMENHTIGTWTSVDMINILKETNPDIIYHIGEHRQDSLLQILKAKKEFSRAKIMAFSMRGHQQSLKFKRSSNIIAQGKHMIGYVWSYSRLIKFNKNCDVVFCHYPDALQEFKKEGFKKPIYMQTQVGVDTDIFFPCQNTRKKIRERYNLEDSYVLGSATRFSYSKGLSKVISALPKYGNWKYLMIGSGRDDEIAAIKKLIHENNLEKKIILTGYIENWGEMAELWNAMDCAVHFPLTTPEWEETFSLSLVQAMATGLPVIGSSSGSVPYQLGEQGIVICENDISGLNKQFIKMMNDPDYGREIGRKMYKRAVNCFSIKHLNDIFYDTILDICNDVYDENKIDMTLYRNSEYA